jgi:low affinity Fe/Cu permease
MWFDKLSQQITEQVVRPWFFWLIVAALLAWIPTLFLWDDGRTDLLVDAITNPVQLLLLVLLQNTQWRQEKALDWRQDNVEGSLALLLRHVAGDVQDDVRRRSLLEAADRLEDNARRSTRLATATPDDD